MLLWTVAATATSRIRLNASTFYYEPPRLACLLTTLDVLSEGRLDVGIGVGWLKDEHDIARSAGWLGFEGLPDEVGGRLWSIARVAAQDAGRDPDAPKMAMRINLEPGTSVDSLADKLERLAGSGIDEAFVDAFAAFPSLDQMLDFASHLIARTGACDHPKAGTLAGSAGVIPTRRCWRVRFLEPHSTGRQQRLHRRFNLPIRSERWSAAASRSVASSDARPVKDGLPTGAWMCAPTANRTPTVNSDWRVVVEIGYTADS